MFRLALTILLVVAFAGASTASVAHGFDHGSEHASHHAEMAENDLSADAQNALADCCDVTSGMGSMTCFGDLVGTSEILTIFSERGKASAPPLADVAVSNLTLAVPTGPPKV